MIILNPDEVRQALPMHQAIGAMKRAYAALSSGRAEVPLRTRLPVIANDAVALFMPAFVDDPGGQALALKVVMLNNRNPKRGLPLIHAAVLVMDAETGKVLALLEGGSLTAIRTGAASGAAVDILARPESRMLAIFGGGVQGRTQLEAACSVRKIETAWVYDTSLSRAEAFAREMAGKEAIPHDLRVARSAQEAASQADIICTATTATQPVFADADLKPGTHISAVGSYLPEMQEVPAETVARARVVVDSRLAALVESGDLIQPMQAGLFDENHIHAELGEIVLGRKTGRATAEEITYFKSVGIAVQDAVAARLAIENAARLGLGKEIEW